METSDKELLKLITRKDEKAYNILYKRYCRLFYDISFSYTNNKDVSDDINQIFWITLWNNPKVIKTDENGSAKNFLYKHFTFRVFDYFKSTMARKAGTDDLSAIQGLDHSYTHVMEELELQEVVEVLDKAIADMPALTRDIFICRWEKGYSTAETAEKLLISEQTVRARYKLAMGAVQEQLKSLSLETCSPGIIALLLLMRL